MSHFLDQLEQVIGTSLRRKEGSWQKVRKGNELYRPRKFLPKYELDALANKDFQHLTKIYLPKKLKEKDWLD